MTDVIGVLEEYGDDHLVVRSKDGSTVRIAHDLVVAAKTVPPAPKPRTRERSQQAGDDRSGEEL
jgi:hypothetical protein